MAEHSAVDFLIVGQGIAGSILAWRLLERNYRVLIIYQANNPGCSPIAAGIFNPVAGKRFAKVWNVEAVLPEAIKLYRDLECFFEKSLFHAREIIRLYQSEEQKLMIERRRRDPAYGPFVGDDQAPDTYGSLLKDSSGSFKMSNGGVVEIPALLSLLREFFQAKKCLRDDSFNYSDLKLHADHVTWKEIRAQKVIFCEGYRAVNNPWFSWLPFQLTKGEILSIATPYAKKLAGTLVSKSHWIVPQDDHVIKIGATYDRKNLDGAPTQEGLKILVDAYKDTVYDSHPLCVIKHEASIRPGTWDAKPFIGVHPLYEQLAIFNGFGSKGSLLVPYCSAHLVNFFARLTNLNAELDSSRHWQN